MKDTAAPLYSPRYRGWQPPENLAEIMAEVMEEIAGLHAAAMTAERQPLPHCIPKGMTTADRLCRACRGFGTLYDHYSDGYVSAGKCHVCDGHGFR